MYVLLLILFLILSGIFNSSLVDFFASIFWKTDLKKLAGESINGWLATEAARKNTFCPSQITFWANSHSYSLQLCFFYGKTQAKNVFK